MGSRSVEKGRRLLLIGKELIFVVCQIGFAEGTNGRDQGALAHSVRIEQADGRDSGALTMR